VKRAAWRWGDVSTLVYRRRCHDCGQLVDVEMAGAHRDWHEREAERRRLEAAVVEKARRWYSGEHYDALWHAVDTLLDWERAHGGAAVEKIGYGEVCGCGHTRGCRCGQCERCTYHGGVAEEEA
jgi:hypothetical protein